MQYVGKINNLLSIVDCKKNSNEDDSLYFLRAWLPGEAGLVHFS